MLVLVGQRYERLAAVCFVLLCVLARESRSTFGILRHVQGKLGTVGDPYGI